MAVTLTQEVDVISTVAKNRIATAVVIKAAYAVLHWQRYGMQHNAHPPLLCSTHPTAEVDADSLAKASHCTCDVHTCVCLQNAGQSHNLCMPVRHGLSILGDLQCCRCNELHNNRRHIVASEPFLIPHICFWDAMYALQALPNSTAWGDCQCLSWNAAQPILAEPRPSKHITHCVTVHLSCQDTSERAALASACLPC
jgi:hypothetical protein